MYEIMTVKEGVIAETPSCEVVQSLLPQHVSEVQQLLLCKEEMTSMQTNNTLAK